MSTGGIIFLVGIALAPFTAGLSLIASALSLWQHWRTYDDRTGIDDSQFPDIIPAHEEAAQRVARIMAEAPERRRRYLAERDAALEANKPPAYAWYQCSGAMCRHAERLLTWHGDTQQCENCGRSTYRMGE